MIAFKNITELEIVESFNKEHDTIASQGTEVFKAGEPIAADIVSEDGGFVDLQFACGGLALGVLRSSFEVLPITLSIGPI